MNRNRFIDRLFLRRAPEGERFIAGEAPTGTQECVALATVLATSCSEEFLEALIRHKNALDEWGGQIYIASAREKFDPSGKLIEHRETGQYETLGYVFHYGHRSQIKGQVHEPDTPLLEAEALPAEEPASNGSEPEPDPVEA